MINRRYTREVLLASALGSFLICGLLTASARGQEGPLAGVAIGYEYGVPLAIERSPGIINRYAFGGDGYSYNHTVSVGARLVMPDLLDAGIGITAGAGFAVSWGNFRSVAFAGDSVTRLSDQSKIVATEEFEVDTKESLLLFDLRARFGIGERLAIELGPWMSTWTSSWLTQTERILAPDSTVFPNGLPARLVATGGRIASARVRYGASLSASYGFDLTYALTFRPELFTRVDGAMLGGGLGLRAFTAGVGMTLLYDAGAVAPIDTPPPPVTDDQVPKTFLLEASVHLTTGEPGVARVKAESARHRTYVPLLPAIYSDSGSPSIPVRYVRLAGPAGADRFGKGDLVRLSPLELHHQTLNILGMRLRGEPSARVVLTGYATPAESPVLARARAEEVASYLRDVWGIRGNRVSVKIGGGAGGPARGVEIASSSPRVTAPVVVEWIVRDLFLPKVGVAREIKAEAGVRRWDVTIRQGSDTISRYSSIDEERGEEMDAAFRLPSGAESSVGPLVAELVVEDYTGAKVVARDSVRVSWGEKSEERIDREVFEYLLPDPGRGAPDPVAGGTRLLLESLGRSLRAGAHVTIAGSGKRGWQAGEIARKVLDICSAEDGSPAELHVLADGEPEPGAALPESMIIGSGVRVTIEQEPPADRAHP